MKPGAPNFSTPTGPSRAFQRISRRQRICAARSARASSRASYTRTERCSIIRRGCGADEKLRESCLLFFALYYLHPNPNSILKHHRSCIRAHCTPSVRRKARLHNGKYSTALGADVTRLSITTRNTHSSTTTTVPRCLTSVPL